jgi:hypothetical protein
MAPQSPSLVRGRICTVLTLSLLMIVILGAPQYAVAQLSIPFDGLRLVYFSETTRVVQEKTGTYAKAWITFVFHNVTVSTSRLDINVNGTLTQNGRQQNEEFNRTVDFPTDRDTLVFLRDGGQNNVTIYAGPIGVALSSFLPGVSVDLTRSWNLHDKPLVKISPGSFTAYRYHTSINSLPVTVSGINATADLDFYASYETNTQVLLSGEVWATVGGLQWEVAYTDLQSTNLLSAIGSSRCLIATATYGSDLAPPVQFLRDFRDQEVEKTFAGSNFMAVFNLWYYSFSPAIAQAIYASPRLRNAMQVLLYPLIIILEMSATIFTAFRSQSELAALLTGLAASAMIAIAYLWIPSILICRRYRNLVRRGLVPLLVLLDVGIFGLLIAEVLSVSGLAAVSSAMIVVSSLFFFAALPSLFIGRHILPGLCSKSTRLSSKN